MKWDPFRLKSKFLMVKCMSILKEVSELICALFGFSVIFHGPYNLSKKPEKPAQPL